MHSRERFQCTMNHEIPDRAPIDIAATALTGMSPRCQSALRDLLGFSEDPTLTNASIDERILRWAGTDFRGVGGIIDLPSAHTCRVSPTVAVDCWGIRRKRVGQYDEITHHPLKGATTDDLDLFPWPEPRIDEKLLQTWEAQANALQKSGTYVVLAEHPVYGILELGCWMCGYDEFLLKMASDQDFVRTFFDKVLAIQMGIVEQYYSVLGPYIDLTTSGDDFGMQTGPLISPRMFKDLIAPCFSARIERTKELAGCYYWHHTCGSVASLLDEIIDCGVDILNPLQTSAASMDPPSLKARFGDRLVFWGGVDVQQFLPQASPDEVEIHVRDLVRVLGADGGYVIAPAHNMQEDIPPQNIAAWVETVRNSQI